MGRQQNVSRFQQIYGQGYASGPTYQWGNNYQPRPWYNPNAMDVDAITTNINTMTFEERNDFFKKGLCFKCKKPGLARNCPNHGPQNYGNFNNWNFNCAPAQWNDNWAFVPCNNNPIWNVHDTIKKPGFEPQSFKSYNLTPEEHEQQEEFIRENLKKGYIWPSKSPMASPFFFVSKKDRRLRPTQDYQYLNQWTIKNAHPLPLISDIMDKIKASGAKYFTKFDIR